MERIAHSGLKSCTLRHKLVEWLGQQADMAALAHCYMREIPWKLLQCISLSAYISKESNRRTGFFTEHMPLS
jgi:hypothetical protein